MFASDNTAPAHPRILAALSEASADVTPSYGADPWTKRAEALLCEIFERDCEVLLVPTGTAANALALAALVPPWGGIFTHRIAHIEVDEGGAPEFYTAGAKLLTLDGPHAMLEPATLDAAARRYSRINVHGAQPFAVSISQCTESGAVYAPDAIAALGAVCRAHGLALHMDGARFANALVATGASAAGLSWKAGVDIVSFGATKNGALGVEAIVCFGSEAAKVLPHLRKRAGHLFSKHRYLAAQMVAYLEHGLWLELARAANGQARALAAVFTAAGCELVHPADANMLFVRLSDAQAAAIRAAGAAFHPSAVDGTGAYRFVCSWATRDAEIAALQRALQG